jgi:predicted peptidase
VPDKRHYFPLEIIEDNENRGTWISDEKILKHSSTLSDKYDIFKYRLYVIGKYVGYLN